MSVELKIQDKSEGEKLFSISRFRSDVRKTLPHRHDNYFEIIYFTDGAGVHDIDGKKYAVQPPIIFFIRKDEVHFLDLHKDINPKGFVIIIKPLFVSSCLDAALKKFLAIASLISCLRVDANNQPGISVLFEIMDKECNRKNHFKYRRDFLEGMLKSLFASLLSFNKSVSRLPVITQDKYQSFLDVLNSRTTIKNKIAYYANLLHMTPQNLNAICRKHRGQSATEVLSEYIINEERRQLIYTDNTVSEIASQLEFSDASHFIKYFKRYTGYTPQSYRLMQL